MAPGDFPRKNRFFLDKFRGPRVFPYEEEKQVKDRLSQNTEERIRRLLAAGDAQALELIYDRLGNALFGYLRSRLCSREQAEDVLQAVFVRLAEKRAQLAQAGNLTGYLFRLARNEAINWQRQQARKETHIDDWEQMVQPRREKPVAEDEGEAREVSQALARLPEEQREVIILKVYCGLTFAAIATQTGASANTTASRYRYGLEKLRRLLRRFNNGQAG